MNHRPLRSCQHMPANPVAGAQPTSGPAAGVLRLAGGRPGPVALVAHARYQASRRRSEEQRSWELVDRIVSLEDEVRTVRDQADRWTTAALSQMIEIQRRLEGDDLFDDLFDEPRGRHAKSPSTADTEPRCDRATRKKE